MEVLAGWELATMVEELMHLFIKGALSLASFILLLRIFVEVCKGYFFYKFKFTIPQFMPIFLVMVGLLTYAEIMPMIGDAFYRIGEQIRGQAELSFKLTNIWTALQEKLGVTDEEQTMWDLTKNWAGYVVDGANPWDWLQNWWGLATAMTWQGLGILFRYGMIFFKNIVYCYMLICGPLPLVLSLIPGFAGFAAHWLKNFIVVCYWNITIAVLDAILQALNVQILADIALAGDEEMTIGLLTMLSAMMYFFIPYLTSLAIGQTVVAMAGAKMIMTPLATAAALGRMAAGGPAATPRSGTTPSENSASVAMESSGGQRNQAGLLTMGTQAREGVRTSYSSYPVQARNHLSGRQAHPKAIGHTGTRKRVILSPGEQPHEGSPVIYAAASSVPTARRLPPAQGTTPTDIAHETAASSPALADGRRPKYLLGPKKE